MPGTMKLKTTRRSVLGAMGAAFVAACQKNEAPVGPRCCPWRRNRLPKRARQCQGDGSAALASRSRWSGLGGFHLGKPERRGSGFGSFARRSIVESPFSTHCWDYNGGASEERMGKALKTAIGSAPS